MILPHTELLPYFSCESTSNWWYYFPLQAFFEAVKFHSLFSHLSPYFGKEMCLNNICQFQITNILIYIISSTVSKLHNKHEMLLYWNCRNAESEVIFRRNVWVLRKKDDILSEAVFIQQKRRRKIKIVKKETTINFDLLNPFSTTTNKEVELTSLFSLTGPDVWLEKVGQIW